MSNENLCSVGNYSVLIPYSDLEKLVNSATKIEDMEKQMRAMERRNAAMHSMYSEILEKYAELYKML